MHDLIIIGGGAAGLSAAVYAMSKQLDFQIIYEQIGGKAGTKQHLQAQTGEEYIAGADAVAAFEREVAARSGAVVRDRATDVSRGTTGGFVIETQRHGRHEAMAVVVATGAAPVALDVPGARALVNHGIGYSITTHSHLLSGKTAAVVGTTVRALRGVAELARIASHVYLIAPDAEALKSPLARVLRRHPNVSFFEGYSVTQVIGEGSVEQLAIARDEESAWIQTDALFADLGLLPNSGAVRDLVRTDADGFIWVDESNSTSVPGVFAAGDVTTAMCEQVLIAIGEGARAASSAYEFILEHLPLQTNEPSD